MVLLTMSLFAAMTPGHAHVDWSVLQPDAAPRMRPTGWQALWRSASGAVAAVFADLRQLQVLPCVRLAVVRRLPQSSARDPSLK